MKYTIYTDGGSRGNPGPAAIGIVIKDGVNEVWSTGEVIGKTTNNIAEYTAVLRALKHLQDSPPPNLTTASFFLDSLLVVEQLNGRYKIKNSGLLPFFTQIQTLRQSLGIPTFFSYVPRAKNAQADGLVNQALDSQLR